MRAEGRGIPPSTLLCQRESRYQYDVAKAARKEKAKTIALENNKTNKKKAIKRGEQQVKKKTQEKYGAERRKRQQSSASRSPPRTNERQGDAIPALFRPLLRYTDLPSRNKRLHFKDSCEIVKEKVGIKAKVHGGSYNRHTYMPDANDRGKRRIHTFVSTCVPWRKTRKTKNRGFLLLLVNLLLNVCVYYRCVQEKPYDENDMVIWDADIGHTM